MSGVERWSRVVESLVRDNVRIRRASEWGDLSEVRGLVEGVFVREKRYLPVAEADKWDQTACFYLLTVGGIPAGCLRIVDLAENPLIDRSATFRNDWPVLPIEEIFPIDGWVENREDYFEPGRIIVVPDFRRKSGFLALMATAFLYATSKNKRGAVCLANPGVVRAFTTVGWRAMGDPIQSGRYGEPACPLHVLTHEVESTYQKLFFEMQREGVVRIE